MEGKEQAVALCRVSSLRQHTEGSSLLDQDNSVRRAEREKNLRIMKVWSLVASRNKHKSSIRVKDLDEIIAFCKTNPKVKYLLVDKVSRLMRDVDLFNWYQFEFKKLKVIIWFCSPSQQHLNGDDQVTKLQRYIAAMQADQENDERIAYVTERMRGRVLAGYCPFPNPAGYITGSIRGLKDPDPNRFALLQQSMRLIASGTHTPSEACKWLKVNGYLTPQGKALSIDKYKKILANPFYAGTIRIKGWPELDGLHKAMISTEEHTLIQSALKRGNRKYQRLADNPAYPMKLLVCETCGKSITGFAQRSSKTSQRIYHRYACKRCKYQLTRGDVHNKMNELLNRIDIPEGENLEQLVNALAYVHKEKTAAKRSAKDAQIHRLRGIEEQAMKLVDSYTDEESPLIKASLKRRIEAAEEQIEELKQSLDQAFNEQADLEQFTTFALEQTQNVKADWWNFSVANRKRCESLLFPAHILISRDGSIRTPEISPVIRLGANIKGLEQPSKPLMVELRRLALRSESSRHHPSTRVVRFIPDLGSSLEANKITTTAAKCLSASR